MVQVEMVQVQMFRHDQIGLISVLCFKMVFKVSLVVFSLVVANLSFATKPDEYWKNMMKGQAMPEAIKGLIQDLLGKIDPLYVVGKDRFIRDFDIKPIVILYDTHVMSLNHNHMS
ncbi:uncharacterized protein [Cicer arietinum]|uniref:Uncharacterized protein LOC101507593 n=1 Tax=Cicer arietinum TaxID=3827 RepID=A0A1S3DW67_CICAR|nr:uncharacterized protein LOC101507593 [Cicer arietinum]